MAATAALLGLPTSAAAEVVPPENSAANQYTETYPTAGGDRETQRADDIVANSNRPGSSGGPGSNGGSGAGIDSSSERQLEAAGADGRGVVQLVETTAPPAAKAAGSESSPGQGGSSGKSGGSAPKGNLSNGLGATDAKPSGTEEVLGQVTGSASADELGLILPLLLLATLAWATGFLWRRRREA